MHIYIEKALLAFPVDTKGSLTKLMFKNEDGAYVYECDLRPAAGESNFTAYLDVRRFIGKEIDIVSEDGRAFTCTAVDEIDRADMYGEPYRPYYHFTERNGWHNDPNGLVKDGTGMYHMYFQFNPADTDWGNMHWGHAVSRDMLRWTEKDIAMFPDGKGMMYSGSGYLDSEGLAGFGKDALLFYYTAAGGMTLRSKDVPYTQCLAYSTDNGMTLRKYGTVIDYVVPGNRDPKIVRCDEMNGFVIPLYLTDDEYALYLSEDLLHWCEFQRLHLPGDNECPDLYPLTADDGTRRWVFSGAAGYYITGEFVDGCFVTDGVVRHMHADGPVPAGTPHSMYAAQTYSALPDGRRINVPWEEILFPGDTPFRSQMGLPTEHTLVKGPDGYRLQADAAREAQTLRVRAYDTAFGRFTAPEPALEMILRAPYEGKCNVSLFGEELVYENGYASFGGRRIRVTEDNGTARLHLYRDVASLEIYAGEKYDCFAADPDKNGGEVQWTGCEAEAYALENIFRASR